jgi:hypothetical protein
MGIMAQLERSYRRILTYSRLGCLSYLYYYGDDGVAYRELKSVLDVTDSTLASQLYWLKKNEYAKPREEKIGADEIAVYYITPKGKDAYMAILKWFTVLPLKKAIKDFEELNK